MIFNNHNNLKSAHAFLSPSNYHWLNYDEEKLRDVYEKARAKARGSALHSFAKRAIELGIRLPNNKQSLNQFVNDAIGFRMSPEQVLFYSPNAFGTTDAISFRSKFLRIHDLKNGTSRVQMSQLEVYAALFCLEYAIHPKDIDIELRIYQSSKILVHVPEVVRIKHIMEKIKHFDKVLNGFMSEEFDPSINIIDNLEELEED